MEKEGTIITEEPSRETEKTPETIESPYSAIVVCGATYSGSKHGLSPMGLQRVMAAYHAYKLGLAPKIVVTGGQYWDSERGRYLETEDIDTATFEKAEEKIALETDGSFDTEKRKEIRKSRQEVSRTVANSNLMKAVLVNSLHIPEEDILCDEHSVFTTDNFAEAINELQREGLSTDNLLVISDGFHIGRIENESTRYGKKFIPMAVETSLLLRSLDTAERQRAVDQENQEITKISDEEIEERYKQALTRWRPIYHKRTRQDVDTKAKLIAEEILGGKKQEDAWHVWGPLMLTLDDPQKIAEIFDLGVNKYNSDFLNWKKDLCERIGVTPDIADDELKELIISRKIDPLFLRKTRATVKPTAEERGRMIEELIQTPELMKQYIDIGGIILILYHRPLLLEKFLKSSTYVPEIDSWRKRHESNLGIFKNYGDFCIAVLQGKLSRESFERSRENIIDPDRRKSEIIDQ